MQLLLQFQCYYCGDDCGENCVEKINCEVFYALSAKSSSTPFIVMLKKWLFDFTHAKNDRNKNICLITQMHQQSQSIIIVNEMDSMQMERKRLNLNCNLSECTIGEANNAKSIDCSCFSTPNDTDVHRCDSIRCNGNVSHELNHNELCHSNDSKIHRNEHRDIGQNMHKRRCNSSSTNYETVWSNTATDHGNNREQLSASKRNANKTDGQMPPPKQSLKFVNRSPLTVVNRANLIKYLLILNCFVCFASGNLMSRNIGNDLSSKQNQTSIETATATFNSSALRSNSRISTTASPLILNSIIGSNQSENHNSQIHSQDHGRLLHAMQEELRGYAADMPDHSHKLPNGEESREQGPGCSSCQLREQLKAQNLQSIKMHILARLSMTHPPNITSRPHISEQILQHFYQSNDFRYIRIRNSTDEFSSAQNEDDVDDNDQMQGDDPIANSKHQHHHLHEYDRNIKSGIHEQQHHHHQSNYHHHNRHSRLENEYNEEYDYTERGSIIYNMDYYDDKRSSSRLLFDEEPYDGEETENEPFYSTTDVIYSFPKLSKARHRGDILEFTIKNNHHLSVSGATFNLYVHGEDWLTENEPNLAMRSASGNSASNWKTNGGGIHIDDADASGSSTASAATRNEHNAPISSDSFHKLYSNKNVNKNSLSISINRFIHRHQQQQNTNDQEQSKKSAQPTQQQRYTRIDSNFVGEIPKGAGEWIQFNITLMVSEWIQQQQQRHQSVNIQSADIVQEVVIKTLEPWMRQLLVLDTNSKNRPYIEIQTRDMRKHRTKRHMPRDCKENERQSRCCRYPLRVDFRKFGWDWIIAPDIYEAFYCAGDCPIGFLPKNPHAYIYSLSSTISACCSPRKLSPLSLLYFDDSKNVIHSVIPNMAVEKCGCS